MAQVTKIKGMPITNWRRQAYGGPPEIIQDKRHKKLMKMIGLCVKNGGHVIYYLRVHKDVACIHQLAKLKSMPYQVVDCELHWR